MKWFLFWISILVFSSNAPGYAEVDSTQTTGAADSPLTWLKPPATDEELKMFETLKDDPVRAKSFVKMRMIFRILGYPTPMEHENVSRKDDVIEKLVLPEIRIADLDYVFNNDEQILRYKLDFSRSKESGMGLADLAKVHLPDQDSSPLQGDEISQWKEIMADPGELGGKVVNWEVRLNGNGGTFDGTDPIVFGMDGCLFLKNASGKKQSFPEYPVHLYVVVPIDKLGEPQTLTDGNREIPFIDPRKAGLGKGNVIRIINGVVDKNTYHVGYGLNRPIIHVLKYEQ